MLEECPQLVVEFVVGHNFFSCESINGEFGYKEVT